MTAPAPSPYEQSEIDRFGIFAEEEVVAEALEQHALAAFTGTESACACDRRWVPNREYRAHLAAAAVAAYRAAQDGGAEEAVRRVEALAAEYERTPPGTVTRDRDVALDLRAALAPQAGDGAR